MTKLTVKLEDIMEANELQTMESNYFYSKKMVMFTF